MYSGEFLTYDSIVAQRLREILEETGAKVNTSTHAANQDLFVVRWSGDKSCKDVFNRFLKADRGLLV